MLRRWDWEEEKLSASKRKGSRLFIGYGVGLTEHSHGCEWWDEGEWCMCGMRQVVGNYGEQLPWLSVPRVIERKSCGLVEIKGDDKLGRWPERMHRPCQIEVIWWRWGKVLQVTGSMQRKKKKRKKNEKGVLQHWGRRKEGKKKTRVFLLAQNDDILVG